MAIARRYPPGPRAIKELQPLSKPTAGRLQAMVDMRRKYGETVHAQFLNTHYYFFANPEDIRQVLVTAGDHFYNKLGARRAPNDSKLIQENRDHQRQRRILQPAFQASKVSRYAPIIVQFADELRQSWQPGEVRDIATDMTNLTLRIIAKAMFNADVRDDTDVIGRAVRLGTRYLSGQHAPWFVPTQQNRQMIGAWLGMNAAIKRLVAERRTSGVDQGDLLSTILNAVDDQDNSHLSEQEAQNTIMGVYIAGHETTASLMGWVWYLLAQHPDAEQALHAELDRVLADRTPTYADLNNLPYTDWVIHETMRLYPPAWALHRFVIAPTEIGGYGLTRGSEVVLSPFLTHRDERFFPDPDCFQPERWANNFERSLPRYAFFPFGGGGHVCVGQFFAWMEAPLLLATIAQHYRLRLEPGQQIGPLPLITLRADKPILMRLEPR